MGGAGPLTDLSRKRPHSPAQLSPAKRRILADDTADDILPRLAGMRVVPERTDPQSIHWPGFYIHIDTTPSHTPTPPPQHPTYDDDGDENAPPPTTPTSHPNPTPKTPSKLPGNSTPSNCATIARKRRGASPTPRRPGRPLVPTTLVFPPPASPACFLAAMNTHTKAGVGVGKREARRALEQELDGCNDSESDDPNWCF
ncbi:hypothetical protein BD779DRAFT_1492281 [Infundibulicybe gibba]|nr:hypothetical protein BD779DRAFT_1492281 [Infundibulicybe gibba]